MTDFWYDYLIFGSIFVDDVRTFYDTLQVSVTGVDNAEISNFLYRYKIGEGLWTNFPVVPEYSGGTWNAEVTFTQDIFTGQAELQARFDVGAKTFIKEISGEFTLYLLELNTPAPGTSYNIYRDGYVDGGTIYCDVFMFLQVSGGTADSVEFEYNVNAGGWTHFADGVAGEGDGLGTWSATGQLVEADVGLAEIRAVAIFKTTREVISDPVILEISDDINVIVNVPNEGEWLIANSSSTMTISTYSSLSGLITAAYIETYREGAYVGEYALAEGDTIEAFVYYDGNVSHPSFGNGQIRGRMVIDGETVYTNYVNVTWLAA